MDFTTDLGRTSIYGLTKLPEGGVVRSFTSPAGLTTVLVESADGSLDRTDPDGSRIHLGRSADPRWGMLSPYASEYEITQPSGLTFASSRSRTVSLLSSSDPLALRRLVDTWDVNGRSYSRTYDGLNRESTTVSPEGRRRTIGIDTAGRPVSLEAGGLGPVAFGYDSLGRLALIQEGSAEEQRTTLFGYDDYGYLETVTDPIGRSTRLERDAVGRVLLQELPDGEEVSYGYDAAGNLASVTPPGRPPHQFVHGPDGRLLSYSPPPTGGTLDTTTYSYNRDHQLVSVSQPSGRSVSLSYESSGRLSTLTIPQGSYLFSFSDSSGKLEEMESPDGELVQLDYDGSLRTGSTWLGPIHGTVERDYDANFWVTATRVNGSSVAYSRDRDGALIQVGDLQLTRDPSSGLITGSRLGQVATTQQYDSFGDLATLRVSVGGEEVFATQLQRDSAGRVVAKVETIASTSVTSGYSYDARGRLAAVTRTALPAPPISTTATATEWATKGRWVVSSGPTTNETDFRPTASRYSPMVPM